MKAVIFDLDDTLFLERSYVLSGFRAVGEWISEAYSIRGFFETAARLFGEGHRGRIFDEVLSNLGIRADSPLIDSLVACYRNHRPEIRMYDDAERSLAHYRRYTTTGIITDGYLVAQKRKVAVLGLEQLVDHIVYSDESGRDHWKPSSVPYLMMMKMTGCTGPDCSYVSDNPLKDFVTAKALGWTTVRIRRTGGEYSEIVVDANHSAQYEVSTLDDLAKVLVIESGSLSAASR